MDINSSKSKYCWAAVQIDHSSILKIFHTEDNYLNDLNLLINLATGITTSWNIEITHICIIKIAGVNLLENFFIDRTSNYQVSRYLNDISFTEAYVKILPILYFIRKEEQKKNI